MKRFLTFGLAAVMLIAAMTPAALAAQAPETCYPSSVTRSEDGKQILKYYDLSPEDDPAGIPRYDFEQEGFHYTMTDLLKQEMPEYEERLHTQTVTLESKSKDMETILTLLPQEKEFTTEDGFTGTLTLRLETVQVEVAGYGTSTREVSASRSYPNLSGQDTSYIPKTIEDGGRTMTLQSIDWQTDNTADLDGYAMADRYTAVATYTGTATNSYVTGYTVTADYAGTVSKIALNKVRYVAVFEGTSMEPVVPDVPEPGVEDAEVKPAARFNWAYVLIPLGVVILAGAGVGVAVYMKHRRESEEEE